MSIDPRTLKQLLELQIYSKLNLLSSSTASAAVEDDGSDFGNLLQTLLSQADPQTGADGALHLPAGLPQPGVSAANLAVASGMGALGAFHPSMGKPSTYEPLINQAAAKYGVDSSLIKAVIEQESSFNSHAVSSAGAKGLMQLMDATARGLGVTDSFDPQQNIEGGTQFLAYLLDKYNGNEGAALAAYNAGPNRIDRMGIANDRDLRAKYAGLPKETQGYVDRVLAFKRNYQV